MFDFLYSHFLTYATAILIGTMLLVCIVFPAVMAGLDWLVSQFSPNAEDSDHPQN